MVRLSVNVNKVATLRNARGGSEPSVIEAVETCVAAGAPGITVHPRADRRHITPDDVREIARALDGRRPHVEYNIEGNPRPELIDLVHEVRPDQCTLVPVLPGEITSQAGWQPGPDSDRLGDVVRALRSRSIRVSLFVDAEPDRVRWAAAIGADRVELYTEPYARAFESARTTAVHQAGAAHSPRSRSPGPAGLADGPGIDLVRRAFDRYCEAARLAHSLRLGVNAGHDLDLHNLVLFRDLPHLDEVSIGHALVSRALFVGLSTVVREYLELLAPAGGGVA
jgi:pyridoxine 5-phosphate synthase